MRVHFLGYALLAASTALGCSSSDVTSPAGGNGPTDDTGTTPETTDVGTSEQASITYTREEEKLARDVYTALAANGPIFGNIAIAEQQHMDAVAKLLTTYGLPDPAAGKAPGQFTDPRIQALYDTLVAQGSTSVRAALAVGVEIEELDIHDITNSTAVHHDVELTFANLTRGSRNHLRSFYGQLTALGGTYVPQYLDAATFQSIVSSPMEQGPTF